MVLLPSGAYPPPGAKGIYQSKRGQKGCGFVGRRRVSVAGGGGGGSLCRGLPPPAFPGWAPRPAASSAHSWVPPFRRGRRRRRRAAGRQRVMREWLGGRLGALDARLRSLLLWSPPLGFRGPLGGAWSHRPSGRPPPTGWGLGGGWVPLSPPLVPWRRPPTAAGGGGAVIPVPGGRPPTGGAHPSPVPLRPPGARSSLGPPALLAVAARRRPAGGGGEGW